MSISGGLIFDIDKLAAAQDEGDSAWGIVKVDVGANVGSDEGEVEPEGVCITAAMGKSLAEEDLSVVAGNKAELGEDDGRPMSYFFSKKLPNFIIKNWAQLKIFWSKLDAKTI